VLITACVVVLLGAALVALLVRVFAAPPKDSPGSNELQGAGTAQAQRDPQDQAVQLAKEADDLKKQLDDLKKQLEDERRRRDGQQKQAPLRRPLDPLPPPEENHVMNARQTITIDRVGNGELVMEYRLHTGLFTNFQKANLNEAVLLRGIGLHQHWSDYQDIKGGEEEGKVFNPKANTLSFRCSQPGLARIRKDDFWEMRVGDGLALVALKDDEIIFAGAAMKDIGLVTQLLYVRPPEGASDLKWDREGAGRLTYRLPPSPGLNANLPDGKPQFKLDPRSRVMTCFRARNSPRENFPTLWVARAVLRNNTNKILTNYRVKFRVLGFTDWSPEECCKQVVPGQSLVDAYFPEFNQKQLAAVTDFRKAQVEVDYEYEFLKEGKVEQVHETDRQEIELEGPDRVILSSMKRGDAVDFRDRFDNAPFFLASFVTPSDKVIEWVAEDVRKAAGSGEFSIREKDAKRFLRKLYAFMQLNKIRPIPKEFDHEVPQMVKYGRDLLLREQKTGTCIDLAIFYASVCKAAQLKVKMFLFSSDGRIYCVPVIVLPESGLQMAVETLLVEKEDFDTAVARGNAEVANARKGTNYYEVDVQAKVKAGVVGPELAEPPDDWRNKFFVKGLEEGGLADLKLEGRWKARSLAGDRDVSDYVFKKGNEFEQEREMGPGKKRTSMGTFSLTPASDQLILKFKEGEKIVFKIEEWRDNHGDNGEKLIMVIRESPFKKQEGDKIEFTRTNF
jgi:hypothetical protein